jgi:predicted GIY-YIG superfamily endonuclease
MTSHENRNKKHYWLYVIKQEQGKYYIGITAKSPEERYLQHVNGFMGAKWTKKYKPISLFDTHDLGLISKFEAEQYENRIVRIYIKKYGYNNVRGGDLSYNGNYIKRFGWYYTDNMWSTIILIVSITILMVVFGAYTIFDLLFDKH